MIDLIAMRVSVDVRFQKQKVLIATRWTGILGQPKQSS